MRKTLWYTGWRYLLRHPWQSVLMILGITLGVAVTVAVDLANASASRAFDLSAEAVAGRATHQISGGPAGIDQQVYARLRQAALGVPLAPVIAGYVASPQLGERPMQLLGVDPFAEAPFRSYLADQAAAYGGSPAGVAGTGTVDLLAFLTQPGAVLLAQSAADRYGLAVGSAITLEVDGRLAGVTIAGLVQPADALSQRALDGLLLADIATAQEITGRLGRLDHIDAILPEGDTALAARIRALLPPDVRLDTAAARSGAVAQMTAAFRVNLTALSMLALVVGMFLIYNTMTFSVVQRRALFGTLRCLGVTRQEVFTLVMSEALLAGLLGALLGVGLGLVMGQGAVRLVTQTVNDLFFVVTVRGVQILPGSLLKGALLGVLATLFTAAPPAWEAASVPPRAALSRSVLEVKARRAIYLAGGAGMAALLAGLGLLALPGRSLVVSFAATFATVVGFAMLVPLATGVLMRLVVAPLGRLWGTLGRMAPRDVINSLSRTSIAVMALMVAVSVTIGVSLMVSSFRSTVIAWLAETLQGDIYISAPGLTSTTPSIALQPSVVEGLRRRPEAVRVDTLRSLDVDTPDGPVHLAATDNFTVGEERAYLALDGRPQQVWAKLLDGAVLISEPLANRLGIARPGGEVTLYTAAGAHAFPVAGIYYDYASTRGTVLMALPVYQALWRDPVVTAAALRLAPGVAADALVGDLQAELAPVQRLQVRANAALRQEVLTVFDRTFAITGALQLLATIVAFIGVLSALLSLELERQREMGILRSIGMTVRQLWALILLETGLMGAAAGLLAMPTGYILALILVYIINRRSFGWTLQMDIQPLPFAQALLLAVAAALLAGLYPAYRMGRMITSEALRSE
jgi:putative ABC transport system permease protein